MTEDFNDITEAGELQQTAMTMLRVIQRHNLPEEQLRRFHHYFVNRGVSVTLAVFRDWITQIQRELDSQASLKELATHWTKRLGERDTFTQQEAEELHHQYASVLDTNAIIRQPVVIGLAEREAGSPFDVELSQPARNIRWVILYTVKGQATLKAGIRDMRIGPGDVLLLPPNAMYHLNRSPDSARWNHYWLSFHPHTDWRHHLDWPMPAPHVGHVNVPQSERNRIRTILNDLMDNSLHPTAVMHDLEANLLLQFILRCRSYFPDSHHRVSDERVENAKRFVEEHLSEAFTLEQVAEAVYMSPSRLAALFKSHTGLSVFSWRNERRLIQAAHRLRSSDEPISSIGTQLGFSDPTYFSRTFRQHIGCSPKQYRNQQQSDLVGDPII
ncbi:arabinose operon transcriptional regulator AraC [Litorivivens sp.]|uniref:arabinose operon transcriptional regulator AraC n=1 Tax=Litorivivens sp. TaxID=2020868 RepID=UPI00356620FB